MRKLFLPLLSVTLLASCVDKDYDLGNIDTDNVTIGGDESVFECPLATVLVTMDEIAEDGINIQALFEEADVWLPSPLPENAREVDLQKLQLDPPYVEKLLDALVAQMLADPAKLGEVAALLSQDKYIGTFLPLLPAGTSVSAFAAVFTETFRRDEGLRAELAREVKNQARNYLTSLHVEPLEYVVGHIDISDDVVDMLADNLDPETVAQPKNTLHLKGTIANELPVGLRIDPLFDPTGITFGVDVVAGAPDNRIPDTRLFADDLRQIVDGITIRIPVTLKTYLPGEGFRQQIEHQIRINLHLVKHGGLKLDI